MKQVRIGLTIVDVKPTVFKNSDGSEGVGRERYVRFALKNLKLNETKKIKLEKSEDAKLDESNFKRVTLYRYTYN